MTTIDKLDLAIYIQYARRTQLVEQINQQYHLEEAVNIPPQTRVLDLYPKLSELDILLGVVPVLTPWAYFYPPKNFENMRRSPFTFGRVAPSLGDNTENDDEAELAAIECKTKEEEEEKSVLQACLQQVRKINEWLGFIIGRVGQFLQG
jgi:hypothetical protein